MKAFIDLSRYLWWFNPAAGNSRSLTPPLSPQWEEKWAKGETPGLRQRQFIMERKEILLLLLLIIMNMQKKLYTLQFSHHLITDSQSVPEQQSQNLELTDFTNFLKLLKKM